MTQWRRLRIGDIGRVVTGGTPPATHPDWFGEGLPFITPTDIAALERRARPARTISDAGAAAMSRRLVPSGSVCFVCIGATIGKLCLTSADSFTNQQINSVVPNDDFDGTFLYYLLRHEASRIARYAGGAATPIINKGDFSAIEVVVPDRRVQTCVASVLGSIDDLIESNRRQVEVLEDMARAIYREWFVRFRYPGDEGISFGDSPLGSIPDGWSAGRLRELATEIRRSVKPSAATAELPYLPIDAIDSRSLTVWGHRPGSEATSSLRLFRTGDVVFGAMRAYFHKVCVAPFDGVTRSTCFVLRPDPKHYWYTVLTLTDASTVAYAAAHSSGSTIPYAKWDGVLSEMPVVVPPTSVSGAFGERLQPLLEIAQKLADQVSRLVAIRDLLLPMLVTGKIEVSHLDLDELAEAATA